MEETVTIATILPLNYPTIEEVQDEIYYGIEPTTTQIQLIASVASQNSDEENTEETTAVTMQLLLPTTTTTTELNQLLLEPQSQVVIASKNTRELVEIGVKNALSQEFVTSSKTIGQRMAKPETVIATTIAFIVLSIVTCMVVGIILLRKRLRSIRIDDSTPQQLA